MYEGDQEDDTYKHYHFVKVLKDLFCRDLIEIILYFCHVS